MSNQNLLYNTSRCVIFMKNDGNNLRIHCTGDSLQVIDGAGWIKLHSIGSEISTVYRVEILVETVSNEIELRGIDYGNKFE